jgi:predicted transposase/invertase (TIGR01784 family)
MEPDLTNVYELRNVRWLNRHYGDIPNQIVLLMLANLKERPLRELSSVERWAYLFQDKGLRYGARRIEEVKEIEDPEEVAAGDKAIERFIQRLDLRHLPQEVVDRYHSAIQYYNDTIVDIEEKGMTKGIAKGEKKKAIDIAKKMLKRNRPIEEIMEDTELTREEVEAIRAGRVLKDDSVANSEDGSTSAN